MPRYTIIEFLLEQKEYLLDKIDAVYYEEVSRSIERFIARINRYFK